MSVEVQLEFALQVALNSTLPWPGGGGGAVNMPYRMWKFFRPNTNRRVTQSSIKVKECLSESVGSSYSSLEKILRVLLGS